MKRKRFIVCFRIYQVRFAFQPTHLKELHYYNHFTKRDHTFFSCPYTTEFYRAKLGKFLLISVPIHLQSLWAELGTQPLPITSTWTAVCLMKLPVLAPPHPSVFPSNVSVGNTGFFAGIKSPFLFSWQLLHNSASSTSFSAATVKGKGTTPSSSCPEKGICK